MFFFKKKFISNVGGFTLLEAMTAMVIVSTAGMALFAWVNSNIESFARVQEHTRRFDAMAVALNFMEGVNPMEKPKDAFILGGYKIEWNAKLIEPIKQGAGYPGGISPFVLGLYNTRVFVFVGEQDGYKNIASFDLRQVGFEKKGYSVGGL